jgi:cyclohexanone monooxygenase
MVHSIETHVDWLMGLLAHAKEKEAGLIEADADAEDRWVEHVNEVADQTLYPQGNSWYVGANMPGKPRVFMPYVAGVPAYRRIIESVAANDFAGLRLSA